MKKLGMFVMPLMTIFLFGCNKPGPVINTYTFTFNCPSCKVLDAEGRELTTFDASVIENSKTLYTKFYLKGTTGFHNPLESSITVKKGEEAISFEYFPKTGEIIIPVVGNLTITARGINKTLEECTWDEINEISTSGRADEFFDVYNPDYPELNCKKVQLKHQDRNGNGVIDRGEVYQTVRIIGINQDCTDINNPEETKIGLTLEFANSISDENGYSLATQWNDVDNYSKANHNYLDSSVRMALVGKKQDEGHILWAQKEAESWSNEPGGPYTDSSVLDMLPNELTKEGVLKAPSKYINIFDGSWREEVVNDKLFLLSPVEMGKISHGQEEPSTTTYTYYDGVEDAKRIKKQINGTDICDGYSQIPDDKGQTYSNSVDNYAGFNNMADDKGGGYLWLRSPDTDDSVVAWYVYPNGELSCYLGGVHYNAYALAPAFCI